jgi:SAM-dependent methyltransferase
MRNESKWTPSKFLIDGKTIKASSDLANVSISSRHNVDLLGLALSKTIPLGCKGRLLDLGCGKVPLYYAYRRYVNSVVCADWTNGFHEHEYLDVFCDISQDLPFKDLCFDSVLLTDVIEHVPSINRVFNEVYRILDKDGTLLLTVPFLYWLHEEPYDYSRYTEHALRCELEKCGFEIVLLEQYGGGIDVLIDICSKMLFDIHWRIGPLISASLYKLGKLIKKTKLSAKLSRKNRLMPIGYVVLCKKI